MHHVRKVNEHSKSEETCFTDKINFIVQYYSKQFKFSHSSLKAKKKKKIL